MGGPDWVADVGAGCDGARGERRRYPCRAGMVHCGDGCGYLSGGRYYGGRPGCRTPSLSDRFCLLNAKRTGPVRVARPPVPTQV